MYFSFLRTLTSWLSISDTTYWGIAIYYFLGLAGTSLPFLSGTCSFSAFSSSLPPANSVSGNKTAVLSADSVTSSGAVTVQMVHQETKPLSPWWTAFIASLWILWFFFNIWHWLDKKKTSLKYMCKHTREYFQSIEYTSHFSFFFQSIFTDRQIHTFVNTVTYHKNIYFLMSALFYSWCLLIFFSPFSKF